jgi:hypothetical protein
MRQFATEEPQEKEVTIFVQSIQRETDKAIRIAAPDGESFWLPKSQVEQQRRLDGTGFDIVIPRWMYEAKDMEEHGL